MSCEITGCDRNGSKTRSSDVVAETALGALPGLAAHCTSLRQILGQFNIIVRFIVEELTDGSPQVWMANIVHRMNESRIEATGKLVVFH